MATLKFLCVIGHLNKRICAKLKPDKLRYPRTRFGGVSMKRSVGVILSLAMATAALLIGMGANLSGRAIGATNDLNPDAATQATPTPMPSPTASPDTSPSPSP